MENIKPTHACPKCKNKFCSEKFIDYCPKCGEETLKISEINPPEIYQYNGIEFELPEGYLPISIEK